MNNNERNHMNNEQPNSKPFDYHAAWLKELDRYNSVIDAFPRFIKEIAVDLDEDSLAIVLANISRFFQGHDIEITRTVEFSACITVRVEASVELPYGKDPEEAITEALDDEIDADNLLSGYEVRLDHASHEIDYIEIEEGNVYVDRR